MYLFSPQLLRVLIAVAASISPRGFLSTYWRPHTLLLSPSQMAFITERNFANRCPVCLEMPSEIQGRDNLLCVLVVCVGFTVCMIWEDYTLLTYFLTLIGLLLALRKLYPSHRKCNLIIFILVELDGTWRKRNSIISPHKPGVPTVEWKWKEVTTEAPEYSLASSTKYTPPQTSSKLVSKTFHFKISISVLFPELDFVLVPEGEVSRSYSTSNS